MTNLQIISLIADIFAICWGVFMIFAVALMLVGEFIRRENAASETVDEKNMSDEDCKLLKDLFGKITVFSKKYSNIFASIFSFISGRIPAIERFAFNLMGSLIC